MEKADFFYSITKDYFYIRASVVMKSYNEEPGSDCGE